MSPALIPVVKQLVDISDVVLKFWHGLLGSWGLSIIFLTFTIRLVILPLTFKGVKSMQALQVLQPEMKALQERYKGDKQRLNEEMMKFYKENKVNPLGSCLPLALQIPFFIALFQLLRHEDLLDGQSFLFIDDLALKLSGQPVVLGVMILLYVGTQLAATAVTAVSADKNQQRIMYALPFVFVLFIVNFPAGLIVYWITTNFWTIGQQLVVKKLYPKPVLVGATAGDAKEEAKPARGKPPPTEEAKGGDGKQPKASKATSAPKVSREPKAKETGATVNDKPKDAKAKPKSNDKPKSEATNGDGAKPPPSSPRKKKKRSGRRR